MIHHDDDVHPDDTVRIESKFLSTAHQAVKQRKAHIREILLDHNNDIEGIFDDICLDDSTIFNSNTRTTNSATNASVLQLEAEFHSIHQALLKPLIDTTAVDFRSFEQDVLNSTVVLDEISLQSIQHQEQELAARSANQTSQADVEFQQKWQTLIKEHDELMESIRLKHQAAIKQTVDHSVTLVKSHSKWMKQMEIAMEKIKIRMIASIEEQRRIISDLYGDLVISNTLTWTSFYQTYIRPALRNRFHKVVGSTHLTHSVISIRIDCLRAVKSKLPAGTYAIMATLYSRLGDRGERMTIKETIRRSHDEHIPIKHYDYTRAPQRHTGLSQSVELAFDQPINHLYLALENDAITITSCLLIEVIALKGSIYQADRTVGYQYWPISDLAHQLNIGLIKLPLIRGNPRDGEFDQERTIKQSYAEFQAKITNNIDRWLCNCYMTIDLQGIDKHSVMQLRASQYDHLLNQSVPVSTAAKQAKLKELAIHNAALREINRSANEKKLGNFGALILNSIMNKPTKQDVLANATKSLGVTNSSHQHEWEKMTALKRRFTQLSAYHSSCHSHASQAHHKLASRTRSSKFELSKLFLHEISLSINRSMHLSKRTLVKFVILFAFMFIVQFLVHYLSHYWSLTKMLDVEVYLTHIKFGKVSFDFYNQPIGEILTHPITPYTMFSPGISLLFLVVSFYGNILFSLILLIIFAVVHRCAHVSLPHFAYESMLIYCCHCIISPVYSLVVNAAYSELYTDEWVSVISAFNKAQMSFLGALLCITVFLAIASIHVIILLIFVLFEWEAGSLLDVFARLVASEAQVYVPLDLEVSSFVVLSALMESAKWRGMKGGRRRVMATQYLPNETSDPRGESLLHVSVWNVTPRKRLQKSNDDQIVPVDAPIQMPTRASIDSLENSFTRAQASSFSTASPEQIGRHRTSSMPSQPVPTEEQTDVPHLSIDSKQSLRETRDLHRHFLRQADGTWIELIDGVETYGADRLSSLELRWLDEQDKLFDATHNIPVDVAEDDCEDQEEEHADHPAQVVQSGPPRITMIRQPSLLQLEAEVSTQTAGANDTNQTLGHMAVDNDEMSVVPVQDEDISEEPPITVARSSKRASPYPRRHHNRLGSLQGLTIKEEDDEPDE